MKQSCNSGGRLGAFWRISLLLLLVLMAVFRMTPASAETKAFRIGILQEPRTLNVWLASDAWSSRVLSQMYEPLYIREPQDLKLVPWLAAADPVYDAATLSYTVPLRHAKWSDGSPLTAADVAFTGRLIQTFRIPRYISSWDFIEEIEALDPHTVRFVLKAPRAIFTSRTLTTPIVQKKRWAPVLEQLASQQDSMLRLLNHEVTDPVSSGPFVLKQWKKGAFLYLKKNPHFFAHGKEISGYRLGPHIPGIIFKVYGTTDAAVLALKKGTIDFFWWGLQPGYLADLDQDCNVRVFSSQKSALYYVGLNLRRAPFDDIHFRQALATVIDKEFIIKRILHDYAVKMDSVVPPSNTFWYCPDVRRYGEGLGRDERIRRAYRILQEGGYSWEVPPVNGKGEVVTGEGIKMPDGREMRGITILTPPADYDPHRAMIGIMIQEWVKMLGMDAVSRPMPLGAMIHHVKTRHEFDCFVLGYGSLSLDPDYLRNFFISTNSKPKGWNTSGYHNPEFDRIAEASARTLDREKRRQLIWAMQKMVMEDLPWIPLYCPKLEEGARAGRFQGWINMVGGIGNKWSFCRIRPQ